MNSNIDIDDIEVRSQDGEKIIEVLTGVVEQVEWILKNIDFDNLSPNLNDSIKALEKKSSDLNNVISTKITSAQAEDIAKTVANNTINSKVSSSFILSKLDVDFIDGITVGGKTYTFLGFEEGGEEEI